MANDFRFLLSIKRTFPGYSCNIRCPDRGKDVRHTIWLPFERIVSFVVAETSWHRYMYGTKLRYCRAMFTVAKICPHTFVKFIANIDIYLRESEG